MINKHPQCEWKTEAVHRTHAFTNETNQIEFWNTSKEVNFFVLIWIVHSFPYHSNFSFEFSVKVTPKNVKLYHLIQTKIQIGPIKFHRYILHLSVKPLGIYGIFYVKEILIFYLFVVLLIT